MKVTQPQLEDICRVAQLAGREVMDVYRQDFAVWEKADSSPLTLADTRSDAVIREQLTQAFPGIHIWSEESSSGDAAQPATFFLVDPLDGTREFLKRNDEFTVNIALVHQGKPIAGVVLAPASGELFFAARGRGAWAQVGGERTTLRGERTDAAAALRVMGSRSHGGAAVDAWLAKLDGPYEFVAAGSSLKFCRLAQGRADIYPRLGPTSQWDTAAAQAVLEQAGGAVLDPQGCALRYGLDLPVLNPHFVALRDPAIRYPPLI